MATGTTERLARAALTTVFEPGLSGLTGLLEAHGAEEVWRDFTGAGRLLTEQLRGLAQDRVATVSPERQLARIERIGGRLICPGDEEWSDRLNDLAGRGFAPPVALWA